MVHVVAERVYNEHCARDEHDAEDLQRELTPRTYAAARPWLMLYS
jgi:hypothetical protein